MKAIVSFLHLVLHSLMDEGEFARLAVRGGPQHWVQKVQECIEAAKKAGDMVEESAQVALGGWCAHQLIARNGDALPAPQSPLSTMGSHGDELANQATWFCLRGMGLKDKAIRRHWDSPGFYAKLSGSVLSFRHLGA